ncbi:hypothetical protein EJ05DRAFT_511555 [Pseudovirgaria hyperparasitica]|uniref:C4-dicarboxylate transporter/malic acid transport protein n=1 Tax=Pseudovirgaria hyperparasitica TaxID=470096 RepID=A0A6A6W750_9PEZI|nr:uncharacterized protein EJ05DRAFT_511555 [Pseudovirgaria hyperparasitica]KAF2757790.1 hypothetical protein EJ05DRAFT_511555 [Pseudovirgaria hyperparasitica]
MDRTVSNLPGIPDPMAFRRSEDDNANRHQHAGQHLDDISHAHESAVRAHRQSHMMVNDPYTLPPNGHSPPPKRIAQKRSLLRNRIGNFKWNWFACTMSTGGLAIAISESPKVFSGMKTIGKIFMILDIVLFITFTCCISTRFILEPKAFKRSLSDPTEAWFFGCWFLSQATIIGNIEQYGIPASGPWLVKAQEILLWCYVAFTIPLGIGLFAYHFATNKITLDKIQPSMALGIYPTMLAGTLASLIALKQPPSSALPIIIGGIAFQGLGFMISYLIFAIFIYRCFAIGLPAPQTRVGMFIMVGSPGYTAAALQGLGNAAAMKFPVGYMGTMISAGEVLKVVATAVNAWLWLLSLTFFGWSVVGVGFGLKEMRFDVTWWAVVFPNVGWTIATALLGKSLDSQGIQWVSCGMIVILVVCWIIVAYSNVKAIAGGQCPPP